MILELTGLPGAGKTTCEQYLSAELNQRGYQVLGPTDVLRCYIRNQIYANLDLGYSLRRHLPVRAMVAFIYQARVRYSSSYHRFMGGRVLGPLTKVNRKIRYWLGEDALLYDYLKEFQSSDVQKYAYVASEGLAHHTAAARVFGGNRGIANCRGWIQSRSFDNLIIVHVRVSPQAALERLLRRGVPCSWPRKTRRNKNRVEETLRRFASAIEASIQQYQAAGAQVFTVGNSGDVAKLATRVASLADSLPHAARLANGRGAGGDVKDAEERILGG